jgi:DNA-binding beta-propeller fold protein YncE
MKEFKLLFLLLVTLCSFLTTASAQWLETTIPVGTWPWALVWNSQNNKVYCANYASNNVMVSDGRDQFSHYNDIGLVHWSGNSIQNQVYVAHLLSDTVRDKGFDYFWD